MSNTNGIRFIPKQARSTKTRDRLIAEGATLYRTVGRDRLTTAEVAAAAGVAIGTFYRYFADRVALLDAVAPNRDTPSFDKDRRIADLEQKITEQAAIIEAALKVTDDMRSGGWHIGKTVPDLGEKLYQILTATESK